MKKIKNKTKKFKTDEPEIPFTFDFYLIYWEDIQSDSGWRDLKDIQDSKPAICVSTGWLVKKDKQVKRNNKNVVDIKEYMRTHMPE